MSKFVYAITRGEMDNELLLNVSTKECWSERHCMSDSTPKEVYEFLDQHDFNHGELMEGVIEISNKDGSVPASEETEAGLVEVLGESELFEFNVEFQDFLEECPM